MADNNLFDDFGRQSGPDNPFDDFGRQFGGPGDNPFDDFGQEERPNRFLDAGRQFVGGLASGTVRSLSGLPRLIEGPLRSALGEASDFVYGEDRVKDLPSPTEGLDLLRGEIDRITGEPKTGYGVAGGIAGTLGGEVGGLIAGGSAASKTPQAVALAKAVAQKLSRVPLVGRAAGTKTAKEVAFATPYNLGNAARREDTFAGSIDDLTEGQDGPILGSIHDAAEGMSEAQEKAGVAGRFAGETLVDAGLSSALNVAIPGAGRIYRAAKEMGADGFLPGIRRKAADVIDPSAAKERRSLERAAYTDEATGLQNRNAYQQARAAIDGDPFREVVAVDMRNLKGLNDLVGHDAGDEALSSIGKAMGEVADEMGASLPFRTGGDEFVAAVPKGQADAFVSRIRELVPDTPFDAPDGRTLSWGVDAGVGETFSKADEVLTALKAANKVNGNAYRGGDDVADVLVGGPGPDSYGHASDVLETLNKAEAASKAPKVSEDIVKAHLADDGSTFDPRTGENFKDQEAFSVSPYKDRETVISEELTSAHIDDFMRANADLLEKPDHVVGTWFNKDDGKSYLDVSILSKDRDEALRIGAENDQLEPFALKNLEDIPVVKDVKLAATKGAASRELVQELLKLGAGASVGAAVSEDKPKGAALGALAATVGLRGVKALGKAIHPAARATTGEALAASGTGAGVGAAVSEDKPKGAALGALAATVGPRGVRALGKAIHPAARATTGEALAASYATYRAKTEEDAQKARGWAIAAGVAGTLALRDAPLRINPIKVLESQVGGRLYDQVVKGVDKTALKIWETNPTVGHFLFPAKTLGEKFRVIRGVRKRAIAESRMVAKDLSEKISSFGGAADVLLSKAVDIKDMDPAALRKVLEEGGVGDVDGAMEALTEVHEIFRELGTQLVDLKLLSDEAFQRHTGQYAPRLYDGVDQVMDRVDNIKPSGKIKVDRGAQGRLKQRKEPDRLADRKLESLKARAALGVVQETQVAATERFFQTIAAEAKWVDQDVYRLSQELKDIKRLQGAGADKKGPWDPKEWEGRKAELGELAVKEQEVRKALKEASSTASSNGMVQLPKDPRLGSLSNTYVDEAIKFEIQGMAKTPMVMGSLVDFYLKWLRRWKIGKTALNPATHGRNIVGAQTLSWMGDGPTPFSSHYVGAMKAVRSGKGELYDLARTHGLLDSSYVADEIKALGRTQRAEQGTATMASEAAATSIEPTSIVDPMLKMYADEDLAARVSHFSHAMEVRGMGVEEAAKDAKKWVPTFDELSDFTKAWSRVGAPFFAYTAKALPRSFEALLTNPTRFLAVGAVGYGMGLIFHEDQVNQDVLPPEMRGAADRLPVGDWVKEVVRAAVPTYLPLPGGEDGKRSYLDFTYVLPYGDIAEGRGRGSGAFAGIPGQFNPFSNPLIKTGAELALNRSSFTDRDIVTDDMDLGERAKARTDYVAKQALPTLTPEVPGVTEGGWGYQKLRDAALERPNYVGETRSLGSAIMDAVGGMKQRQIDPEIEQRRRVREMEKTIRALQGRARDISRDQSISPSQRDYELTEIDRRIQEMGERISSFLSQGVYERP